eukprot:gene10533-12302_t
MEDFENVYEPSDDTFLLCDAIENDREHLAITRPNIVLEVGCGSGCVITFLSMLLKEEGVLAVSLATDINPYAAASARRTAAANNVHVDVILTNLVAAVHERLYHKVDVLVFNPPYVPTPSEEIAGSGIEVSWAGGIDGREVIDVFLPYVEKLLSPTGSLYMVLVQENKPQEITKILQGYGLQSE